MNSFYMSIVSSIIGINQILNEGNDRGIHLFFLSVFFDTVKIILNLKEFI